MSNGIVAAYNAARSQMAIKTITTLADVGAGNVAISIGTGVGAYQFSEIVETLRQAADKLRQIGFPKATTAGNYVGAGGVPGAGYGQISVSLDDASTATPVETEVGIVYQDTFDNVPHSTAHLDVTVKELIDYLLESQVATG